MSIRLIVTDMDGTLLNDDHVTLPPRNVAALRAARERGVSVAIASGRTWSIIRDTAEALGGVDYAILSNGAAVLETASGRRLSEQGMPNAQARALIDGLSEVGWAFEVYCRGQNFIDRRAVEQMGRQVLLSPAFVENYRTRVQVVEDLKDALEGGPMEKINLFYAPPEVRERLRAVARATGPVEITNAMEGNMEFTAGGVCKGAALQQLCARLGLEPEEVMAFGDGGNDVEMLAWAGWSFAMENGMDQAKAAARRMAPANEEGGVGQMVERYVLGAC